MSRAVAALLFVLAGCGDQAGAHDAGPIDAAIDGQDCDGGCAALGEVCGDSPVDLDSGTRPCAAGLVCCYPCGIPDCADRCTTPCTGPGCQDNGCPGPFP